MRYWTLINDFRFDTYSFGKGEFRCQIVPGWRIEEVMNRLFPDKNCSAREEMERG